ncbi:MAG: diaminopimelate epimerase [Candidatus Cloacimonetes bacterium]|nr:diaminopimelate epimerase [Candidatus Cloacimonadota bacterium]
MLIPYIKMQAQGNDFVILNRLSIKYPSLDFPALAKSICKRKLSVGADGLVILDASVLADAKMTIFNADGSQAQMCGSALRCITSILHKKFDRDEFIIETDSGVKSGKVITEGGIESIEVLLGKVTLLGEKEIDSFTGGWMEVGNSHFVVFRESLSDKPHLRYGSYLEYHEAFDEPVNVMFARKISAGEIELVIWERGCGATLACGTGATATVAYGIARQGLDKKVKVNMPGGYVYVRFDPETMDYALCGSVSEISYGEYLWKASEPI